MPISSGTRFGPYELLALIGTGGMGEVYRARDSRLERDVAIKTIAPHLARDPEALDRFQREAKAVAALSHPNILAIHDFGCESDVWFAVTELLEGETVRERVTRGPMPWPEVVRIGIAVADGLSSAHGRGIVHRDIKPANIFLTSDDRVKILDFGLARRGPLIGSADGRAETVADQTHPGMIAGTAWYMSPEQVQGRPLDGRSDVFSLGCVLYEMLTGFAPFQRDSFGESMAAILKDSVPPIASSSVPASVERVVFKCLEKPREARFPSAQEIGAALKAAASDTTPSGQRAQARSGPTVAVLPFRNLTADAESDFFADGVTEDVIAHLAKIRSISVISRTSVAAFKKHDLSLREIGMRLGATTIVEGSVRRFGNRVRIVAQLTATEEDRHLWAETYDRDLTDIFAIQTDVALHIANALKAELSADERSRIQKRPTVDLEAYELYLQGRQYAVRHTDEGFQESIRYFERAVERDPNFALAYVGLARTHADAVVSGHFSFAPEVALRRAKDAVGKALAVDNNLGDAHGVVGLLKLVCDFDWVGAEKAFQLALQLSPGSADIHDNYGWLCSALGRSDDAIRLVRRAVELDPLAHRTDLASELLRAGRCDEALKVAVRVTESEPGFARGHSTLGWAYLLLGRQADGLAALERAASLDPGTTMFAAQLGQAYAMTGDVAKARVILDRLHELARRRYVAPYHFAYVYTGLGEQDAAVDWLERAYAERAGAIYGVKGSFLFRALHGHPRFVALMKKMNLA